MWIHAGRAKQISRSSDYVLREVAGESLIITRADDGAINAFYNVCRHCGTRLCEAAEGTFAGMIHCPYHAWAYDLSGRLVAAPQMDDVPLFCKEDYPLPAVAVGLWDGHIFLNLGEAPRPLLKQLADLPGKFQAWGMEQLRLGKRIVYDVAANWKLIIQNYSVSTAPGFTPRSSGSRTS